MELEFEEEITESYVRLTSSGGLWRVTPEEHNQGVRKRNSQKKWDIYFLDIANVVREKSKDPSSTIGAVIVGPDHEIRSTGFNGFPRGINENINERWVRPIKYQYVSHAERNAIDNAARNGTSTKGCTLYLVGFGPPTVPCVECTKSVIQAGISRVVGRAYKEAPESWEEDLQFSSRLLDEAKVERISYEREES
jgi:dCMP deaminase